MNTEQLQATPVDTMIAPRLLVVLHPNPTRVDIVLNDRMFNKERYSFSRKKEAVAEEKTLLKMCQEFIVGIDEAKAAKNTLQLEISDGMRPREYIPQVITAIKHWGSTVEVYTPDIYVDDRRYSVDPVYSEHDDDPRMLTAGKRMLPGAVDLGVPYTVWTEN